MAGGSEWYKAVRVEGVIGIRRSDLDPVLAVAGAPAAVLDAVERYTENEPLTIDLADSGIADPTETPRVLVLDANVIQIDGGLNEIPRAIAELAVGRDGLALADGVSSDNAVSIAHVVERYLQAKSFVPLRIFGRSQVTAASDGPPDEVGDRDNEPDEWVVLFEGLTCGTSRRGDPNDYRIVLHMTHFTAALEFSSTVSSVISPDSSNPYALSATLYKSTAGSLPPGFGPFTAAGFAAAGLTGGDALNTDFWGYYAAPSKGLALSTGVKGFLTELANQELFDWQAFSAADSNGVRCPDYGAPRKNDKALSALSKIEPFSSTTLSRPTWKTISDRVRAIAAVNSAAGSARAVDRGNLLAAGPSADAYRAVGYRYAMPISFYLNDAVFGPLSAPTAFGADIAQASLAGLAPSSFWQLLVGAYAGRYQIAFVPMANRGLIVPFQPLLDGSWQTLYASEIFGWNDDFRVPAPVRGVVMVSNRKSDCGWFVNGTSGAAGVQGITTSDAVYDSCDDGVFIYRKLPAWLTSATRQPAMWANKSALGARTQASVPWSTAPAAQKIAADLIKSVPAAAGATPETALGVVLAAVGVGIESLTTPSEASRSTANRLAKALYQQEKTSPRTYYVTGRFRYDVAPGSVLSVELPSDKYVRAALEGARDTRITGTVLRVTMSIDRERKRASTSFQLGFCRTESETKPGHALFSESHPFWMTAVYGAPWADAAWIRDRLGDGANINA